MKQKVILITGSSGFIGSHLCKRLLKLSNFKVIGIDMMNNYYSKKLKEDRLKNIIRNTKDKNNFKFFKIDITKYNELKNIFTKFKPDIVVNLAAQAGVRNSLSNPQKYLNYNIKGFLNIIELSKKFNVSKLIYASTSSVYGLNKPPFKEKYLIDQPLQFYAVTKRTNELMAHTWSSLYKINTIGLRFFTVYGPWGRPDMALFKFVKNIYEGKPIDVYNFGNHVRDFTYVDDIINGIENSIKIDSKKLFNKALMSNSNVPSLVFNLGSGKNIKLLNFIKIIEKELGKKSVINYFPLQKGDVHSSLADIKRAQKFLNYKPIIRPEIGIKKFIDWFSGYYDLKI